MGYLNREARRQSILTAAMTLALRGGFTAMTVRAVAGEAGVATGQLHHHFSSVGALRAQAFVALIRQMLDTDLVQSGGGWHERLYALLGSDDRKMEAYIRLWREAQLLADKDDEIRHAYGETMEMWHRETVAILKQGQQADAFRLRDRAETVAWRLIAVVCGLDGLLVLGLPSIDNAAFERHLRLAISDEVDGDARIGE